MALILQCRCLCSFQSYSPVYVVVFVCKQLPLFQLKNCLLTYILQQSELRYIPLLDPCGIYAWQSQHYKRKLNILSIPSISLDLSNSIWSILLQQNHHFNSGKKYCKNEEKMTIKLNGHLQLMKTHLLFWLNTEPVSSCKRLAVCTSGGYEKWNEGKKIVSHWNGAFNKCRQMKKEYHK